MMEVTSTTEIEELLTSFQVLTRAFQQGLRIGTSSLLYRHTTSSMAGLLNPVVPRDLTQIEI